MFETPHAVAFISKNTPLCLRMPTMTRLVVIVLVVWPVDVNVVAVLGLEPTVTQAEVRYPAASSSVVAAMSPGSGSPVGIFLLRLREFFDQRVTAPRGIRCGGTADFAMSLWFATWCIHAMRHTTPQA